MGWAEKFRFVASHPGAVLEYRRLSRDLARNRKEGRFSFLFQCDAKGHFPYLKPYFDLLRDDESVDIFVTGADLDGEVKSFLLANGIRPDRIIEHSSLVRLTDWDLYMSPNSWGNVFPRNSSCPRVQLFHTLADKNIQYGENLLKFNTIFVCGPIHHEFLKKYLFDPFPEARGGIATYDVGYAKIDLLMNGGYDVASLRKRLGIPPSCGRKVVLYAPNWESTSALAQYGEKVFEILKGMDCISLVKLHYMSLLPKGKVRTGDPVEWGWVLEKYRDVENMRIVYDTSIDPYMAASDLMITDYGGAALEFMCTGKPVVYLDCPGFFEMRGKEILEYWSRDSGFLVTDADRLPETVDRAFSGDPEKSRMQAELVEKLIYNRGRAAEAGVRVIIEELLPKSRLAGERTSP